MKFECRIKDYKNSKKEIQEPLVKEINSLKKYIISLKEQIELLKQTDKDIDNDELPF